MTDKTIQGRGKLMEKLIMRTEAEMLELITGIAEIDARIRAVGLNGSRANPAAPRDCFQDYDVVYLVTELESFRTNPDWIDVFGPRIILQTPDDPELFGLSAWAAWAYLMLFKDKNRIDLTLLPVTQAGDYLKSDSQLIVLLDKDGLLRNVPPASDRDYLIKPPAAGTFRGVANEFWWVSAYVAKGLWRGEILYAMDYLNYYVRKQLHQMLVWQAGVQHGFSINTGKSEKYLPDFLEPAVYAELLRTWCPAIPEAIWDALFRMTGLFSEAARQTAFCYLHWPAAWQRRPGSG